MVKHSTTGYAIKGANPAGRFLAPAENYWGQKVYKMDSGSTTVAKHSTANLEIEGSNKFNYGQWL